MIPSPLRQSFNLDDENDQIYERNRKIVTTMQTTQPQQHKAILLGRVHKAGMESSLQTRSKATQLQQKVRNSICVALSNRKLSQSYPIPPQVRDRTSNMLKTSNDSRSNSNGETPNCGQIYPQLQNFPQMIGSQPQLYRQYRTDIQRVLRLNKRGMPDTEHNPISFSSYKRILTVWKGLDAKAKNGTVGVDNFLKFGHLGKLAPGKWLNDVILSAYIKLINNQIKHISNQKPSLTQRKFLILDSLKVSSIFSHENPAEVSRLLHKHEFGTDKTEIVLLINQENHWFFILVEPKRRGEKTNLMITIFDSMASKEDIGRYYRIQVVQRIMEFMKKYYGLATQVNICRNYPRQMNSNDCGVIAICGIRDLVAGYLSWSFNATEMDYERALITKQLIQRRIIGL